MTPSQWEQYHDNSDNTFLFSHLPNQTQRPWVMVVSLLVADYYFDIFTGVCASIDR